MATSDYKINKSDMKALVTSQMVGDVMTDVAKQALSYAKSIAPVQTGAYRDSLSVEQVTVRAGLDNEKRAGAMISTDSPYAASVENTHHVLSRTADHLRGR